MHKARRPSRSRRLTCTWLSLAALIGLVLYPSSDAAATGSTRDTARLPPVTRAEQIRAHEASVALLWNATGSFRANLGTGDFLSVSSPREPVAHLSLDEEAGVIEVLAGNHIECEGETSVRLVFRRSGAAWRLAEAVAKHDLREYILHDEAEFTIVEIDAERGLFEATFSFVGRTLDRVPSSLRVQHGRLRLQASK